MSAVDVDSEWLPLNEYSSEYGISVSTLRRRIKKNQIKYKLIHGKYYLPKMPSSSRTLSYAPVPNNAPAKAPSTERLSPPPVPTPSMAAFQGNKELLDELKKAYLQALQSKEDQIIHLKQQISDLKTLVMYLERENARLNPQNS